jgi:hypothetical protein
MSEPNILRSLHRLLLAVGLSHLALATPGLAVVAVCAVLVLPHMAAAQVSSETLQSILTPDKVESRIGTLEYKDGAPSVETA